MTITDQVRAILGEHGNIGGTAIARKLGASRKAVEAALQRIFNGEHRRTYEREYGRQPGPAAKKLAYATAHARALRMGLSIEEARECGRMARAQVKLDA